MICYNNYKQNLLSDGYSGIINELFKVCNSERYNFRSNNKLLMRSKLNTNHMKRSFS